MNATVTAAPFGYKKDGTPRTRRPPGTGPRYKSLAKIGSANRVQVTRTPIALITPPQPPTTICPIQECGLNFTDTKDPKNSLLVHVRYKAGKGDTKHQLELEKMKKARKTDPKILQARKNARQREYRARNLETVEYEKKLSRGRVKAREILKKEGKEIDPSRVEKMAEEYVNNLWKMERIRGDTM